MKKKPKHIWLVTFSDTLFPFKREFIDLGLKRKRVDRMDVTKVNQSFNFDWVQNHDIKLEITGSCEQFGLFRKAPIYSQLIESGVKVSFIADPHSVLSEPFSRKEEKLEFISLLEKLVKTKKDANISNAFLELGNDMS